MKKIVVDEVDILLVKPRNGLVAFISFIFNNQIYIGNVALYVSPSTSDGYRLVYPDKMLPNSKRVQCVYPINKNIGDAITKEVVIRYKKLSEKLKGIE